MPATASASRGSIDTRASYSTKHAMVTSRSSPMFRAVTWAASGRISSMARSTARGGLAIVLLLAAVVGACTRKTVVAVPIVTTPKYPDFLRPVVPPNLANTAAAIGQERGWAFLQTGDL